MKKTIIEPNDVNFQEILLSVGDAIITTDLEGRIQFVNPAAEKITGFKKADILDQPIDEILYTDVQNLVSYRLKKQDMIQANFLVENRERELISKDGHKKDIAETISLMKNKNKQVTGLVVIMRDISDKKKYQKMVENFSYTDYLTGLFNRRHMEKKLLELDQEKYYPLGLMFLDVNGLKLINDAFGHDQGDELLKKAAEIILAVSLEKMIVCRTGGDEFVVIVPNTSDKEMDALKRKILKKSKQTIMENCHLSLAVGYAIKEDGTVDMKNVKIKADNAMYKDKLRTGKIMRQEIMAKIINRLNVEYEQEAMHAKRVAELCKLFAKKLQLNEREIKEIEMAARLHDIGKITLDSDLLKKKNLTKNEKELIHKHPESGYQILKSVEDYANLAKYVLYHHEWWNGKGYPHGLKGEEIPLESRLIAIVDAFDAMVTGHVNRIPKTREQALLELKKYAGVQFDPTLVIDFVVMLDEGIN